MADWDKTYYTMLKYGFTDKSGRHIQADQGTTLDSRQVGVTLSALQTFGSMDYDMFYATYFNELTLIDLEVTHIDYDDTYGYHHTYDIDEIAFSKQANNPYGDYVLKYEGQEVTRIPFAGTTAPLGETVIEGIVTHVGCSVSFNPVCYEYQIPGGSRVKACVLACSDNISEYRKHEYPPSAAFDYEYAVSDSIDLFSAIFDAQLKGNYWDPEGNAGTPSEPGGGMGDYRRPDQEIGIPGLPEVSAALTGFIGIYEVTATEVQDLAADLWTSNFWQTIIKNFNDPFNNIISLSLIPYDAFVGEMEQIIVGNFRSTAAGRKLITTFYELDCGIIDINEYYGTYADYTLTEIQLYLPFCGVIKLDPSECTNGKVRVVYHFDIFSGAALAFVQTITNGSWHVLYQMEGNIKSELPINARNYMGVYVGIAKGGLAMAQSAMTGNFFGAANAAVDIMANAKPSYQKAGSAGGTFAMLGILYPYLIFSTPNITVPDNFKNLKGYVSNQKVKIGNQHGYLSASVTNDDLVDFTRATSEEKHMITSLLGEGIRIERQVQ